MADQKPSKIGPQRPSGHGGTGDPAAEIVTIHQPGAFRLPIRRHGSGSTPIDRLITQISSFVAAGRCIDEQALRRALQPRPLASIKALACDLADYARHCGERFCLPATEAQVLDYIGHCEVRALRPSTVARRLASLATVHRLVGGLDPTVGTEVRYALRGMRRRADTGAGRVYPIGEVEGQTCSTRSVFTLDILLAACDRTPAGMRDSALLSVGHDAGLRASELVRVMLGQINLQEDGTALLHIPGRRGHGGGEGTVARLLPETMRRIDNWVQKAGISQGPLFRRVAVTRRQPRAGREALPMRKLAWNHRRGDVQLGAQRARPGRVDYAIGEARLTAAAVHLIIKRVARRAVDLGLVNLSGEPLSAAIATLGAHSLRRGSDQLSPGGVENADQATD